MFLRGGYNLTTYFILFYHLKYLKNIFLNEINFTNEKVRKKLDSNYIIY